MNVKVFGFEWSIPKGISFSSFCKVLEQHTGGQFAHQDFALTQRDGFWVGVILTNKASKTFCEKREHSGRIVIGPKELEEGTNMVDFNFFLFNESTRRGLYQYYHNSLRPNAFHYFIQARFNAFMADELARALRDIAADDDRKKTELREKYSLTLHASTLVKQESLDSLIRELKRVKSLDIELVTIHAVEEEFRPVANVAKRCAHKFMFDSRKGLDEAKQIVSSFIKKKDFFKKATVTGIDPGDHEVVYKLLDTPDLFSQGDYDEWTQSVQLDFDDLAGTLKVSDNVKKLLDLAQSPRVKQMLSVPVK